MIADRGFAPDVALDERDLAAGEVIVGADDLQFAFLHHWSQDGRRLA